MKTQTSKPFSGEEKMIRVGCPSHNCGGRCLLRVHVKDDRIIRIETDDRPNDTVSDPQLRACIRGRSYRHRQYILPSSSFYTTVVVIISYRHRHAIIPSSSFYPTVVVILSYRLPHSILPSSSFYPTIVVILSYRSHHSILP